MAIFQRELMYFPWNSGRTPADMGLDNTEILTLTASDHIQLTAWHRPPASGYPLIIYFHGNGGDISFRGPKLTAFAESGFGFLILSYRGFGSSEGTPTEQGLYLDAQAAITYATQTLGYQPSQLMLYGESLGTGIAVEMATHHPVGAVILEAPYTSVTNRAAEIYYWAPVRWLIRDHYDSLSKITRINAPLLLFHGENDALIPIQHGKTLFEAAHQPKQAHFIPNTGHDDFDAALLVQHLQDFARNHQLIKSPTGGS